MTLHREQLRAVAADAALVTAGLARVGGEEISVAGAQGGCAGLAEALYARFYCRSQGTSAPGGQDPAAFLTALRAANPVPQRWEYWTVSAADPHGLLLVDGRGGARRGAYAEALPGPNGFAPGQPVRVPAIREILTGPSGHYAVIGRSVSDARLGRQVRFYWNLEPDGAAVFLAAVAEGLDRRRIPFQAKVPAAPAGFGRADGGVLYLDAEEVEASLDAIAAARAAVAAWLRPEPPLFTRPLSPGLSFAESPPTGESFGMHRSRLIAEGLVRGFESGAVDPEARAAAIFRRLEQYGLDLDALERNPATRYPYRLDLTELA